jgi:cleavage and polyadenylation specificity factor subunit 1
VQIISLPGLEVVFRSEGLGQSDSSFTDDLLSDQLEHPADDDTDLIKQLLFCSIGSHHPRPHILALHRSGRLNVYEAQPRFTLDSSQSHSQGTTRRSLAVRFRKVHTQLLPLDSSSRLQYNLIPFTNIEGLTGVFVTGEKPFWIVGSDAHGVRAFGLKQAAMAFGRTTHLGGTGEYFIRIEDVRSHLTSIFAKRQC